MRTQMIILMIFLQTFSLFAQGDKVFLSDSGSMVQIPVDMVLYTKSGKMISGTLVSRNDTSLFMNTLVNEKNSVKLQVFCRQVDSIVLHSYYSPAWREIIVIRGDRDRFTEGMRVLDQKIEELYHHVFNTQDDHSLIRILREGDLINYQAEHYLKSGYHYNNLTLSLEILGSVSCFAGYGLQSSIIALLGLVNGTAGMEMSKFSPIPIVKAKKILYTATRKPEYILRFKDAYFCTKKAATCSYTSMGLMFAGQAVLLSTLATQDSWDNGTCILVGMGGGMICASFVTAIMASSKIQLARKALKGDFRIQTSPDGVGIRYTLNW